MRPSSTFALVLAALALAPRRADAQGNDHSAPTGGRSALMGNTGVALARDGAGPFLNPATILRIEDKNLAFSVNFYAFELDHYSNWHQPGPADPRFGAVALDGTGIGSSHFHVLPSTLCFFFTVAGLVGEEAQDKAAGNSARQAPDEEIPLGRTGRQKLAVCLGSLESQDVSLPGLSFRGATPAGSTAQVQSVRRSWNRLQIGPSYSVQLTDTFAMGMSLHGVYSSDSFIVDSSTITSSSGGAIPSTLSAGGDGHSIDLAALLGATYRVGRFTFGASIAVPALHLAGSYDGTLHGDYGGAGANATLTSGSGDFYAPPPPRVAVGVGAEWSRLTLEINETFIAPQTDAIRSAMHVETTSAAGGTLATAAFDATYTLRSRAAWNTSVGAEYFVTSGISLVGGVSTNLSTLSALSPSMSVGNFAQQRMNRATLSFGVGSYGAAGEVLIGTQLGYGWGQAIAVNPYVLPNDWAVVDANSYSAMLILAGVTSFRALRKAVEHVESVVTTGNDPSTGPKAKPPTDDATPPK